MALVNMDLEEFQLAVDKIVRQMIEAKLIPGMSLDDKSAISDLANKVAVTLQNADDIQIFKSELNDKNTREAIGLACQAEAAHKNNPNFKFNYTLLFRDQSKMSPEQKLEFKDALKSELTKLFTEMSKFYPHPSPNAKQNLEELAKIVAERLTKEDLVKDNNTLSALVSGCLRQIDLNEKQLADQLRDLYGSDIRKTGIVFIPPPTEIPAGNQAGLLDMAFQGDASFMSELKNPNAGQPDPVGIKMANIVADIGAGTLTGGLQTKLEDLNLLPPEQAEHLSNWPPKPVPSGYPGKGE